MSRILEDIADYVNRHFVGVLLSILLGWYAFTYLGRPFGDPIRADGMGYYAYLPSIILYGDPGFNTLANAQFDGVIPGYTGLEMYSETGHYLNKYNLGVALFALPFFLLAHALTWVLRAPPGSIPSWWAFQYAMDGYSPLYQHAAGLSGLFYFAFGCIVLRYFLSRYYSPRQVSAVILTMLAGTCWLDIGAGSSFGSHGVSVFLFALFLLIGDRWVQGSGSWRQTLSLGVILGAIALVRVPNVLILFVLALVPGNRWEGMAAHVRGLIQRISQFVIMGLVACAVFFPQLAFWKYGTGHWLVNSYGERGLPNLLSPALGEVLFSVNKGVFVWSPLLVLVLPGWFFMRGEVARWRVAVVVLLVVQWYVIASAAVWNAGACFGQRYFAEFQTIAAFPILALVNCGRYRKSLGWWILIASLWSLFLYKLYYTREISVYGLDREALYDVIWWRLEALRNWWLM